MKSRLVLDREEAPRGGWVAAGLALDGAGIHVGADEQVRALSSAGGRREISMHGACAAWNSRETKVAERLRPSAQRAPSCLRA
eukprot:4927054-Pyramimonas_sp.AAC.1